MRSMRLLARGIFSTSSPHYTKANPFIQQFLHDNLSNQCEYVADMAAIYEFLRDKDAVMPLLDKLENSLMMFARKPANEAVWNGVLIPPNHNHKIFSGFLYGWAKEAGFSGSAKVLRFIDASVFHQLLQDGLIIKDNIPDRDHGIWAHAIQQYLVIEKYRETKGTFLQHDPIELYKVFGAVEKGKFSPWILIYDHPDEPAFVSAISLTHTLKDDVANRWPFLSMLIRRAQNKLEYDIDRMRKKHPEEFDSDGVVKRHF